MCLVIATSMASSKGVSLHFRGSHGTQLVSFRSLCSYINVSLVLVGSPISPASFEVDDYAALVMTFEVYFRNVNQSHPVIQQQMRDYLKELSEVPAIGAEPDYCWVIDMMYFIEGDYNFDDMPPDVVEQAKLLSATLLESNLSFDEKLDLVLSIPAIRDVFGENIVRNDDLEITASRCFLYMRDFDLEDVHGQVDLLFDQRAISASQPINQKPEHQNEWAFFSYNSFFSYWYEILLCVGLSSFLNAPHTI